MKTFVGSVVGIAVTAAVIFLSFSYSEARWHADIHNVAVHPRGWVFRTAVVRSVSPADFGNDPPDIPSELAFNDYYNTPQQVLIDMPYRTKIGDMATIVVSQAGEDWVPGAADDNNQTFSDPTAANATFWPFGGLVLGTILSLISGLIAGYFIATIRVPLVVKGRLGTR